MNSDTRLFTVPATQVHTCIDHRCPLLYVTPEQKPLFDIFLLYYDIVMLRYSVSMIPIVEIFNVSVLSKQNPLNYML